MNQAKPIPTAAQIARVLIELAERDQDADQQPMTNMRLQKLLYYVQGWSLARLDKPAFTDRLEAWEHGPVVPPVYGQLKDLGKNHIPTDKLNTTDIDPDLRAFVASVWEDYRTYSAIELRHMTHREDPWRDAWQRRSEPNHGQVIITEDALRKYFAPKSVTGVRRFKPRQPDSSWFNEPTPFDKESA